MLYKKYRFKSCQIKIMNVPFLLFGNMSVVVFLLFNFFYNSHDFIVKIVVFVLLVLFNFCTYRLYEKKRKLSFAFFISNYLTLYVYVRLSFVYLPYYSGLVYYFTIFLGFHLFKNTFSKRFCLRTKVILKGYYVKSQYMKIVLWFLLVFIPSLISHPIVMFTVCQPLLLFSYLFMYYKVFLFFFTSTVWCFLLFLMNKYEVKIDFLKACLDYFSRRACLHYVGNMFGSSIKSMFSKITPARVLLTAAGSGAVLISNIIVPPVVESMVQIHDDSPDIMAKAEKKHRDFCNDYKLKVDLYELELKKKEAYEANVKTKPYGKQILNMGLVNFPSSESVDPEKFEAYCRDSAFRKTYDIDPPVYAPSDIKKQSIISLDNFRQSLESMTGREDLEIRCRRTLKALAKHYDQELNEKAFNEMFKKHERKTIINFVMSELEKYNVQRHEILVANNKELFQKTSDSPTIESAMASLDLSDKNENIIDLELLDSTTDKPLSRSAVQYQATLGNPVENLDKKQPLIEDIFRPKKRSLVESQSTDEINIDHTTT